MTRSRILFPLLALLLAARPAPAHEGHDHADEPAPAAAGPATPRAEAHSELFELVAVREERPDGHALVIHLDRWASGEPVEGAAVEVEVGGDTARAEPRPDGSYLLRAPWLDRAGRHDLTVAVTAGDDADLLAASLTLPDEARGAEPAPAGPRERWHTLLGERRGVLAAGFGFLLGAATVLLFQARGRWRVAAGGLALASGLLAAGTALAHEGHDHDPVPPAAADGPRRLPDGSVLVPKPAQRLLALRTEVAAETRAARAVPALGQVVPDPNASGRVQASQAGRVEPGEHGLAHVGRRVEKGDVLAVVTPSIGAVERGSVQAQAAELEAAVRLAEQRHRRLSSLAGSVAGREIDDARLELEGARRRRAALAPTLTQAEVLRAPVSGVVSAANVQAGSLVESRDVLFEIVDPDRLWVEAAVFDPAAVEGLGGASGVTPAGAALGLEFVGRGLALREGAVPLLFRIPDPPAGLAVGAPVTVLLQTAETERGVVLPRAAVVRGASGGQVVWDKPSAERFVPRPVRARALDGARMLVLDGLAPGARAVVQGAELLGQVR